MPDSMPYFIAIAIVLLYILNSIKILKEYERGGIFTCGHYQATERLRRLRQRLQ